MKTIIIIDIELLLSYHYNSGDIYYPKPNAQFLKFWRQLCDVYHNKRHSDHTLRFALVFHNNKKTPSIFSEFYNDDPITPHTITSIFRSYLDVNEHSFLFEALKRERVFLVNDEKGLDLQTLNNELLSDFESKDVIFISHDEENNYRYQQQGFSVITASNTGNVVPRPHCVSKYRCLLDLDLYQPILMVSDLDDSILSTVASRYHKKTILNENVVNHIHNIDPERLILMTARGTLQLRLARLNLIYERAGSKLREIEINNHEKYSQVKPWFRTLESVMNDLNTRSFLENDVEEFVQIFQVISIEKSQIDAIYKLNHSSISNLIREVITLLDDYRGPTSILGVKGELKRRNLDLQLNEFTALNHKFDKSYCKAPALQDWIITQDIRDCVVVFIDDNLNEHDAVESLQVLFEERNITCIQLHVMASPSMSDNNIERVVNEVKHRSHPVNALNQAASTNNRYATMYNRHNTREIIVGGIQVDSGENLLSINSITM